MKCAVLEVDSLPLITSDLQFLNQLSGVRDIVLPLSLVDTNYLCQMQCACMYTGPFVKIFLTSPLTKKICFNG